MFKFSFTETLTFNL